MRRFLLLFLLPLWAAVILAQDRFFAGGVGGIGTLSADAQVNLTGTPATSAYKPQNGAAVNIFAGWHATEYVSLQGNWVWNRNEVAMTRTLGFDSFEQVRHSSQNHAIVDALLYFRNRRSWVRPYLSGGAGPVRIASRAASVRPATGALPLPPDEFHATQAGYRVAVGVDLMSRKGYGFRYSFSETMSANPFNAQLLPQPHRRLQNFQNLFGFVKYF